MSLFAHLEKHPPAPLAERMRPKTPAEVAGQEHLLGEGKPLALAFRSGKPHSMIFWGPPGVGKTTLARMTAEQFGCEFIALSAVFSGVKDIRAAADQAKELGARGKQTLLFIDEIHRFNKAQQDALLPYVENGLVIFVGATTENPSFEVNSALLSRARLYILRPLTDSCLLALLERARTTALQDTELTQEAASLLVGYADGDARRALNLLEQCAAAAEAAGSRIIDEAFLRNAAADQFLRFDKGGDHFYDQISALHKSIRGSSPDGALYWLCRMLESGADPRYLARRLIRMAWEDVGLADPRAAEITEHAAAAYDRLGSPEGELALAQAALYLASAPKSNAGYNAYNAARAFVKGDRSRPVPVHLRNAPTKLMRELGFGKHYRYAHDEPQAYAAGEHYLPEDLPPQDWYRPVPRGLEIKIAEKLARLKALDEEIKS